MPTPNARFDPRFGALQARPRLRKILGWAAGIVVFIAVTGFLVAPPIVRWQAEKRLSAELDRAVTIEKVSINPFALSATLAGLRVKERDGSVDVLGFDSLYARLSYKTLVRFAPVLAEGKLEQPFARIVRTSDRDYNFQDLVEKFRARPDPEPAEPEGPARFSLNNLQLVDGRIDLDDRAENQQHAVTGININLPFLSNFDAHVDVFVQPKLEAVVNGDPLRLTGESKPFHGSRETRLTLNLSDVDLPRYLDYSPVPLPFRLESGKLDTALSAAFTGAAGGESRLVVSGNATVRELALTDPGGAKVLGFRQLGVVLNSLDVFGRKADVARIGLQSPELEVRREKDGSVSLEKLAPETSGKAAPRPDAKAGPAFAFEVGEIAVTDGRVTFADLVPERAFRRQVEKLELRVRGLGNAEGKRAAVALGFESTPAGERAVAATPARVDYSGEVQVLPVRVAGKLQVLQLKLGDLFPYFEQAINAEVLDGSADVATAFDLALEGNAPTGRVSEITATVRGARLKLPGSKAPFVEVPSATLKGGEVDLAERRIALEEIAIDSPAYAIERAADGTLNATRLLKPVPPAPEESGATRPWVVTLKRLSLENGRAALEDRSVKPSVKVALAKMALTGEELSSAEDVPAKLEFRTAVGRGGSVSLKGTLSPQLSGTIAVAASRIDLLPFRPYLAPHLRAELAGGNVSTRGTLGIARANALNIAYRGDFELADLRLRASKSDDDLLTWKSLRFAKIDAVSAPRKVDIGAISLTDFFARLVLDASGQLNLSELVGGKAAGGPTSPGKPQAAVGGSAAPASDAARQRGAGGIDWLRVGAVELENGRVDFSDFFVRPNYRADLSELRGSISTLTFEQPGDLALRGKLNNAAPLEIRGRVNPLAADLALAIQASARDIELPRLTPYTSKYLGYPIERGKMSVKVRYEVKDRQLTAQNSLYLDQLVLGEKVKSPDAPDLPLPLAVSLLQDRKGVIDVNLPIGGSLDDPEFSIGGIVLQVIGNIVTKAVTAPFTLLGSVAGAQGDLQHLEFDPGSARLTEAAVKKLDALGKALVDRPGVKLDVTGRADPATDREGLRRASVDRAVRQVKLEDLRDAGKAPESVDDVVIDAKEYPELLERAYGDADIAGKPRNFLGIAKDIPVAEMEKLMLASASVSEEDLRDLALRRAQSAKEYLTGPGKIPAERVFIVEPKLTGSEATPKVAGGDVKAKTAGGDAGAKLAPARVDFALR